MKDKKHSFILVPNTSEILSVQIRSLHGRDVVIKWKGGFLLVGGWQYICIDQYIISLGWLKY